MKQPPSAADGGDRLMAERLLAAIEQLNESIVLTDAEDRFVITNRAFRELNRNIPHAILPGRKFEDYLRAGLAAGNYPDATGREKEWLEARLAERRSPGAPMELRRSDGGWYLIDDRRLPDGSTIRFGTDVTDRKRAQAESNERSRDLQLIVDSVPQMITRLDRDERFRFANRAYAELMERPIEEIVGRRIAEVVSPEIYAQIKPALSRALSGDPVTVERVQHRSNGERLELEGRYIPDVDVGGRVIGLIAVHRDVTAERQAQRSLAESEARFRSLTKLSSDWYWEQDANFRNVAVSEDVEKRGGMDKRSRLGKARWELPNTGITEQQWAEHRAQLERHEPFRNFRYGRVGKNGDTVWFSVSGEPFFDAHGRFAGYRGIGRNITERKRAEQALAASEALKGAMLSSALDAIVSFNGGGHIIEFNPAAERCFGWSRAEALGRSVADLLITEDARERRRRELETLARTDAVPLNGRRVEMPALRRDGSRITVEVAVARLPNVVPPVFTAFVRDITDQLATRERLQSMNVELEEHVERRTAELRSALKELDAFTYSVSHDLRAPVGAVSGFAHLLRTGEAARLSDDGQHLLGVIEDNAARMTHLIEGLLRFSRLGRSDLRPVRVSMNDLVRDSLLDFTDAAARADIQVGALPQCEGDRLLLGQVWSNLIGNALKYSRTAPAPRIDLGWDTVRNAYYVRDNGVGFDMAYVGKLFGVFERLHHESEFEGSGIGLAIAERIVKRHGGSIWAEAAPGQGATFWFTLAAAAGGAAHAIRSSPDAGR